ncbi:MAG: diaminopimelate epimerase [Pseudonocardiales bacterium]|nr:MAG: diaminopimelate epimerase [Pseudonocardiales bacterium]
MRVLKGHGTGNDFVVVPDLDGVIELSPGLVRALCDRHAGIGADGVLRVVRSDHEPEAVAMAAQAPYFMDYRNADGSVAEMCGNGIRVVLRYLMTAGVVEQSAAVATRGGVKCVWVNGDGNVAVNIGPPRIPADRPVVTAALAVPTRGTAVDLPNPHVVVQLANLAELAALNLSRPPVVEPPRGPSGQNVEFVVRTGPRSLVMRVHERGVGETQSCGTGICAVVAAVATAAGSAADGGVWQVEVPGGRCEVTWDLDGKMVLAGPAVIVAEIELDDAWLAATADESGLSDAHAADAPAAGG